jgi:hypothetical protein
LLASGFTWRVRLQHPISHGSSSSFSVIGCLMLLSLLFLLFAVVVLLFHFVLRPNLLQGSELQHGLQNRRDRASGCADHCKAVPFQRMPLHCGRACADSVRPHLLPSMRRPMPGVSKLPRRLLREEVWPAAGVQQAFDAHAP